MPSRPGRVTTRARPDHGRRRIEGAGCAAARRADAGLRASPHGPASSSWSRNHGTGRPRSALSTARHEGRHGARRTM